MPGHAEAMVSAAPELFGLEDWEENPRRLHMGRERVDEALADSSARWSTFSGRRLSFTSGGTKFVSRCSIKIPRSETSWKETVFRASNTFTASFSSA